MTCQSFYYRAGSCYPYIKSHLVISPLLQYDFGKKWQNKLISKPSVNTCNN